MKKNTLFDEIKLPPCRKLATGSTEHLAKEMDSLLSVILTTCLYADKCFLMGQ